MLVAACYATAFLGLWLMWDGAFARKATRYTDREVVQSIAGLLLLGFGVAAPALL